MIAIEAFEVERTYGSTAALQGVSLSVQEAELFGFLGPNGAGKTTLVRILTTLLRPTAGRAEVLGYDVSRQSDDVRRLIGVALQGVSLDPTQTGRDTLDLQGRLYGLRGSLLQSQMSDVIDLMGLAEHIDRTVVQLSGGLRRRLDLACAIVHRPRVLFLDEPTAGLDPGSRLVVWQQIEELRKTFGLTVFLTTHYLEEANELANRVAIIDKGRIVASGRPADLRAEVGDDVIEIEVAAAKISAALGVVSALIDAGVITASKAMESEAGVQLFLRRGADHLATLVRAFDDAGVEFTRLSLAEPTLDTVYFAATGGHIESTGAAERRNVMESYLETR